MNLRQATPRLSQQQMALDSVNRIKESWANEIIARLYGGIVNDLADDLRSIAEDNMTLTGTPHWSFIYKNKYHCAEQDPTENPVDLHPSLYARMEAYLTEHKQIYGYEMYCVKAMLKSMFAASDLISDFKQVLPEQVHGVFDGFMNVGGPKRMSPTQIASIKKRMEPFLDLMKGRMLMNKIQGHTP